MKTLLISLFFVISVSIAASAQTAPKSTPSPAPSPEAKATDVSGKWNVAIDGPGQTINMTMDLKQTGTEFTGTTASDLGNGKIDGGKVSGKSFTAVFHADVQGQSVDFELKGTVDGDKITGSLSNSGFGTFAYAASKSK